jgi:hypothetical protein
MKGFSLTHYNSRSDAEPALSVCAKVVGELVPIAADDFLHDPNLLVSIGSRHSQQEDTGMWLLRMVDQLAKVGVQGEDDPLLLKGHG